MKTKTLHRQLHPIHWHGSMYLAIAATLLAATKTSTDMLRYLQQTPASANLLNSLYLRDAENLHNPVIFNSMKHATLSGK